MIIDLKKYLFVGAKKELDQFFAKAQEQGFIEFIDPEAKRRLLLPKPLQNMVDAIKILRRYTPSKHAPFLHLAPEEVTTHVLAAYHALDMLEEEERIVAAEMSRVEALGDFSLEEIAAIEKASSKKIQFFCMKTAKSHKTEFGDEVVHVGTVYDLDYFMTINDQERKYPGMIELIVEKPFGELRKRQHEIQGERKKWTKELSDLAHYLALLRYGFAEEYDIYALEHAKASAIHPLDDSLFAIEGWVPVDHTVSLEELVEEMAVIAEPIALEKEESTPTYLKNKGTAQIGQDLVAIYDVPASADKDPSAWVLWAFALFFAMIISDAGYGFLFLLVGLFFKSRFPNLQGVAKRMVKLLLILSTATIIWGIMITSFFGIEIAPDHWIGRLSPFHYLAEKMADFHLALNDSVYRDIIQRVPELASAKTGKELIEGFAVEPEIAFSAFTSPVLAEFMNTILLECSLLVGIFHISIAFFRYLRSNWAGIGWILFMVGGYLYFPQVLGTTTLINVFGLNPILAAQIGIEVLYAGIITAFGLAFAQRGWKGFAEIATLVSVFADVLSYLRIYALALASAIMAQTFNNMGSSLGLFVGALVILLGHMININIGIMGGAIHGLRLNFIEWYHYCFIGGGRLFKPLKRIQGES